MINEELKSYLEDTISKENNKNETGHNMEHVNYVIRRSLEFAKQVRDINIDMVYTIAFYHDVAHHIDSDNHEILSGEFLSKDTNLLKWFTKKELKIMQEAIEDHRASSNTEPRTIYGKIVSSADRNVELDKPFKRTYTYRLAKMPNSTLDEIIRESQLHLQNKFGKDGYANDKMYFEDKEYEKYLKDLNDILYDDKLFKEKYIEVNKINLKDWSNKNEK